MGRPKKSAPKHVEPEEESQELPEEEPEAEQDDEPEASGKAISKAAAVRDALEQGEEGPEDGVAYIKKVHGIEMTRQMFSSYKAQEKARQTKKGVKPAPATEAPAPRKRVAPAQDAQAPKASSNGEPDLIETLETLKPLIAAMGAEKVKRLVDLLG